jgi:choline dehydrogenase-like flavoprotein
MDSAAIQLAQTLAGAPNRIQYRWNNQWRSDPFPIGQPFPEWHNGLGTTYHEAGTLWMGDDSATSVTDPTGRFHHITNAYACDQSIFPTVGSANPVLTGLTLAALVADSLPI